MEPEDSLLCTQHTASSFWTEPYISSYSPNLIYRDPF
jgi:hypothetical protein